MHKFSFILQLQMCYLESFILFNMVNEHEKMKMEIHSLLIGQLVVLFTISFECQFCIIWSSFSGELPNVPRKQKQPYEHRNTIYIARTLCYAIAAVISAASRYLHNFHLFPINFQSFNRNAYNNCHRRVQVIQRISIKVHFQHHLTN